MPVDYNCQDCRNGLPCRKHDNRTIKAQTCPACNAKPGEPCTQPTETGRRDVKWYHSAREMD